MVERRWVDQAILQFMGVPLPGQPTPAQKHKELPMCEADVQIGHFCRGQDVAACTAAFGPLLWQACRTCPD
jgi:hypothetical protein